MSPLRNSLPNLFIPGAMKAGTTALADALDKHPDIFVIPVKEPMYFAQLPDSLERLDELLSPDRPAWSSLTPTRVNDHLDFRRYRHCFESGSYRAYRVDASATYLSSPDAISKAKAAVPEARFVTILRNPYERAFSAYNYQRSREREPASSFAEAIQHELAGERSSWAYGWRYVGTSLYSEQIERLFAVVPEADRLVMTMEELIAPDGLERIFRFLDLPSHGITLQRENVTRMAQGAIARKAAQLLNDNRIGTLFRRILPQSGIRPLRKLVGSLRAIAYNNAVPPPTMTVEDKSLISDLLEPDLDRLEHLLGRDLSQWRIRPSGEQSAASTTCPISDDSLRPR